MQIFMSDAHTRHHALELDGAELIPSWETPARARAIADAIVGDHESVPPGDLDDALVRRVHDPGYVDFLARAWSLWCQSGERGPAAMGVSWPARWMDRARKPTSVRGLLGYHSFAADCSIVDGTWEAARSSAALAQTATDAVVGGQRAAFALCRPPGHHAATDQFGGYCYLNNAAIAAQRLLDVGSGRMAIVDVDYHHGNGTQQIFYERADVLYCSVHADPSDEFPYFAGYADERGGGTGSGFNLNHPLPPGTTFARWSRALDTCLDEVSARSCDAMIVSLGVDTFAGDPISNFALAHDDFLVLGRRLAGTGLPTVIVMEGGYAVSELGTNVANVLAGFEQGAQQ